MSARHTVIAHRWGNDLGLLRRSGEVADVVEADVHLFRGRLEVRHEKTLGPFPVMWERWHLVRPRPARLLLEDVLAAVPPDVVLFLDLKGPDPRLPGAVLRATTGWRSRRRLVVASRVWRALRPFRDAPCVTAFHSAGTARQLSALLCTPAGLEGICVDRRLLTPPVASALRERAPELWCWTVDDAEDATTIAGWGVTGVISDRPERMRRTAAPRRWAGSSPGTLPSAR